MRIRVVGVRHEAEKGCLFSGDCDGMTNMAGGAFYLPKAPRPAPGFIDDERHSHVSGAVMTENLEGHSTIQRGEWRCRGNARRRHRASLQCATA